MLNHIVIMGRLTRDPEIRYTQSQTPVASFSVAVERDFGGRDGGEKQTDFIDCVAWRQTAEFVSKYFTKGSMAVVSGHRRYATGRTATATSAAPPRSWPTTFISANPSAATAATRAESAPTRSSSSPRYEAPAAEGGAAFSEIGDDDGELPF